MAKKKVKQEQIQELPPREAEPMLITRVIETNYMPYTMSVIVSRALPEIDGFKPSHRKLLYTMYKQGLLHGDRKKSSEVVGATMKLNPHGDAAIYETMVRLTRGNGALLHPFVDSKGNFGKTGSRDMAYAAPRYTEVRLDSISKEIFNGIDEEMVDLVDNFDGSMKEPSLLPTAFPNILVSSNMGIAVGMASRICGFNLREVCETTIALINNPEHNIYSTLLGPDFPTGGEFVYDRNALEQVYETGIGPLKVRSVWHYNENEHCIEVTEFPYTATVEAIIDKTAEMVKEGKVKEISDMRNETDIKGLKIAIDLKRGVDPEKLMQKLSKATQLTDTFPCNFNIIIEGTPKVMGVREILEEWIAWRVMCVERQYHFRLRKMKEKLHLLEGLAMILLDIDKAIAIIRGTEEDAEVIPNLMVGFGIDEVQAEYIAEIKLRNINKEYIVNKISETEELRAEIEETEAIARSHKRIKTIIAKQLKEIADKYGTDRKTKIIYDDDSEEYEEEEEVPDYPVLYYSTSEGYLKKILPTAANKTAEQKIKDGDRIVRVMDGSNADDILIFTDKNQVYKAKGSSFAEIKPSTMGIYLPTQLGFDENEKVIDVINVPKANYSGSLVFVYSDGKCSRTLLSAYETKTNRRKLNGAYSEKSTPVTVFYVDQDIEIFLKSSVGRGLFVNTSMLPPKTSRTNQGIRVFTLKTNQNVSSAVVFEQSGIKSPTRFRTRTLPASGSLIRAVDMGVEQGMLDDSAD